MSRTTMKYVFSVFVSYYKHFMNFLLKTKGTRLILWEAGVVEFLRHAKCQRSVRSHFQDVPLRLLMGS
jgi:hypothetical protein